MKGPYSRARMDKRYKRGRWRCIGRNGVLQKGKWRCVDNGRASKHNKATTMYERITCGKSVGSPTSPPWWRERLRGDAHRNGPGLEQARWLLHPEAALGD